MLTVAAAPAGGGFGSLGAAKPAAIGGAATKASGFWGGFGGAASAAAVGSAPAAATGGGFGFGGTKTTAVGAASGGGFGFGGTKPAASGAASGFGGGFLMCGVFLGLQMTVETYQKTDTNFSIRFWVRLRGTTIR